MAQCVRDSSSKCIKAMVSYIRELEEKKRNTTHERNTPAGRYALASSQLGNFAHPVPAKIRAKHKSFSAKVVSTSIQSQLFFKLEKHTFSY